MVKHERTQYDVVLPIHFERKNVALPEIDFWVSRAQLPGNLESRQLLINCVNGDVGSDFSGVINYQSRDVARSSRKIKDAHSRVGTNPTAKEVPDKRITPEIPIKQPQVVQISH
jgi:hypothetical protein